MFKFTSTPYGARPHRDDLIRTVTNGLHGTSMPAFEALLSDDEIKQVVDYVIFLSIRGETELELIDVGAISDENDINTLSTGCGPGSGRRGFQQVEDGPDGRSSIRRLPGPPSTRESILRGRDLFLGKTKEQARLHRVPRRAGTGDGPSFVPPGRVQPGRLRRQSQRA